MATQQAVEFLSKIAHTTNTLKPMLDQAMRTNRKFPMLGIEHVFVKKKGKTYCRYCGYPSTNLNHRPKDS